MQRITDVSSLPSFALTPPRSWVVPDGFGELGCRCGRNPIDHRPFQRGTPAKFLMDQENPIDSATSFIVRAP